MNSQWVSCFMDGKTWKSGSYNNDKKIDKWNYWHDNGKKALVENYKNGVLVGNYMTYFYDGEKKVEGNYKDGKKQGDWNSWYQNTVKEKEMIYRDDGLTREKKWDDKKNKVHDISYSNGKMDGNVTFWYHNGKVKASKIYKDGRVVGKYTEHRITGTDVSSGLMVDNEMDGKWTFWYHNGQKECEVICKNGELIDGKVWDDDGNKKESLRFNYQR